MTSRRVLNVCLVLIVLPLGWLLGQQPADPPISEQIKQSLFDDLPAGRAPLPVAPEPVAKNRPLPPGDTETRQPVGEDVGSRGETDPLMPLALQMRSVRRRLADNDAGRETQLLQFRIVEQLESLLQSASSEQEQQGSLSSQPPGGNSPANPASSGNSPAGDGGTGSSDLDPPPAHLSPAVQRVWGNLPPDVRAQLRGAEVERFVPKYEGMLEQFYRRLANPAARSGQVRP